MARPPCLWTCRGASGRIGVTATALLCGLRRRVRVNHGVDRGAKAGLARPVRERPPELWPPAQHGTFATGRLPGGQQRAHGHATWGRDGPDPPGLPPTDALCVLTDPPPPPTAVPWHRRALVVSYRDLLSLLRDRAEWGVADVTHLWGAGGGHNAREWAALCIDSEVPLSESLLLSLMLSALEQLSDPRWTPLNRGPQTSGWRWLCRGAFISTEAFASAEAFASMRCRLGAPCGWFPCGRPRFSAVLWDPQKDEAIQKGHGTRHRVWRGSGRAVRHGMSRAQGIAKPGQWTGPTCPPTHMRREMCFMKAAAKLRPILGTPPLPVSSEQ